MRGFALGMGINKQATTTCLLLLLLMCRPPLDLSLCQSLYLMCTLNIAPDKLHSTQCKWTLQLARSISLRPIKFDRIQIDPIGQWRVESRANEQTNAPSHPVVVGHHRSNAFVCAQLSTLKSTDNNDIEPNGGRPLVPTSIASSLVRCLAPPTSGNSVRSQSRYYLWCKWELRAAGLLRSGDWLCRERMGSPPELRSIEQK